MFGKFIWNLLLFSSLWCVPFLCIPFRTFAQSLAVPSPHTLQVVQQGNGLSIEWQTTPDDGQSQSYSMPNLPLVEIGGLKLPAQLIPLRMETTYQHPINVQFQQIDSVPWFGTLMKAPPPIPQTRDGEKRPALAKQIEPKLPTAPVIVLHEGYFRGVHLVVLALTPIFEHEGKIVLATHLHATIAQAILFADDNDVMNNINEPIPFLRSAPAPVNSLAERSTLKIIVSHAGIQVITGTMLTQAGVDIQTLDPSKLQLWKDGTPVALEEHGTTDGTLDTTDELRFYAAPPGDRWNMTDTYWLTVEPNPGLRMIQRDVSPNGAPLRATALEKGIWQYNKLYDSTMPGPDSDHWFAADLRTIPGQRIATLTVPLTPTLPLATGALTCTITGSTYTTGTHELHVQVGTSTHPFTVEGVGNWSKMLSFTENQPLITINLLPGTRLSGVEIDWVIWERTVHLQVGEQGATFTGLPSMWQYEIQGNNQALYDVSHTQLPQRLTTSTGTFARFQDGPEQHTYLISGTTTLHIPTIRQHVPITLSESIHANVLYIAPAIFQEALIPLIQLRQTQGYTATVVDVQSIYDAWSYGQVSPDAIRSFLRYAAATGSPSPIAAIMVGDATYDPHNYSRRNNVNIIPPYMAMVDLWLGETGCENCYIQLDGDSPLSDPMPDMMIGRLPVKSTAELESLVAKIIQYETSTEHGSWRSRMLFVADNYRESSGQIDESGDFAAFADASAVLQPEGMTIAKIYYDPTAQENRNDWREPNATRARQRTIDELNHGAGIVTYVGHSYYWQWAITDLQAPIPYLLEMFDVDKLTNGDMLPIIIEMTCLTSAFFVPAHSGTTIDERFVLHPKGGAIAVWGPTGLGIARGHEELQKGFYQKLWNSYPTTSTLGSLTMAGYINLLTHGSCCQDALWTYAVLGDPLTSVRVNTHRWLYLPIIGR